eukprot:Plantae.Rhodophyta-Purpureofilum_apyrenoidigerum.ctg9708.p1 GENE.Plantae.Rhodophyta-Purpureofilum_apyrenoidigerum.ctg9708~~Plantae.Rhodophyta-Purpureofilum_apyrenoidigerum.ctg9708.p1  ORF type:complete len:256 (-),score=28.98 Plantae.Rhodophyta-Purpureofilum_apyrenoidigerum.ctg9708:98-766(-)
MVNTRRSSARRRSPEATGRGPLERSQPERSRTFYLFKSEGESRIIDGHDYKFSVNDLEELPNSTSCWDGVRNYQARNIMQEMQLGDEGFFYHSSCRVPGIVGTVVVTRTAYPDHTQFDSSSPYYDPKADQANPKWFMVDVKLTRRLPNIITLTELKKYRDELLCGMMLLSNSRLSVQRVSPAEWDFVLNLADRDGVNGRGDGGSDGGSDVRPESGPRQGHEK